jgi:hypothetical protein
MTVFYDITNPSSYDQTNIIKNLIITYPYYTGTTFNNPSNFKENNIKFLHFNGINQNLLSNYVGYNTGNITISTWVRFKTTNLTYVYTRGNQPSPSVQSVQLVKSQVIPDQHMLFSIKGSIGTGSIVESSITTNINQWYFLTSVIDFTSGTIKLYINNTLFSHVISPYFNTLQNVTQGYNIASNSISTYSDIDFSQFIVYEKVLSNTEITNNFNNSKIYFGY